MRVALEVGKARTFAVALDWPGWSDHPAVRAAFREAVAARAQGEVSDVGPRGGRRWPARFAVRYAAWHILDHTWEIQDRSRPED